MRLIRSRDVLQLTGLSSDQLREWTVRRALIHPDSPAQKRGSEAKFSWQTVLLLRLAVVLRKRFCVELQAHRSLLADARGLLKEASFPALWGGTLAIYDFRTCELVSPDRNFEADEDVVLLRLNRHLRVLSKGFGLQEPTAQLQLFPAVPIRGHEHSGSGEHTLRRARS